MIVREVPKEGQGRIAFAAQLIHESRTKNKAFQKQRADDARARRDELRAAGKAFDRGGQPGVFEFELQGVRGSCPVAYSCRCSSEADRCSSCREQGKGRIDYFGESS